MLHDILWHLRKRWWIYALVAYLIFGMLYMGGHRSLGRGGYP